MPGTPVESFERPGDAAFRALFAQDSLGVAELDGAGRLLAVNARLGQLLGAVEGGLTGRSLAELVAPSSRAAFQAELLAAAGGQSKVLEADFARGEGALSAVLHFVPLRDDAGQVSSVLLTLLDVTE